MHRLNLVAGNLKLNHLAGIDVPLLNQPMPMHHDKQFPLGVMPMLTLCNPRLADIYRNLPTVICMHNLREAAAVIYVYL